MTEKVECSEDKILQEDLDFIAESNIPFEKLNNSSILITGGTGLVGISIIRALLCVNRKKNMHIRIFALVRNEEKAKKLYGNLLNRKELELVVSDIINISNFDFNVDYIIHCASVTASKIMIDKPVETINTAVLGTNNMLRLAASKKVKSFVYISSMEMYGTFEEENCVVSEEKLGYINPLKVRSNYPESKRMCENMCIAYLNEYNVPVKIARLAQTFGAGILPGENRVFAQFARSAIKGEDIILHTLGKSEGNYCYTRDMIKGVLTILLSGENGEAYNVSNPEAHITIYEMAKMVAEKIANNKIKVIFDIPENNKFGYASDTKMLLNSDKLKALKWKPEVNLEGMYRRMILSMKSQEIQ